MYYYFQNVNKRAMEHRCGAAATERETISAAIEYRPGRPLFDLRDRRACATYGWCGRWARIATRWTPFGVFWWSSVLRIRYTGRGPQHSSFIRNKQTGQDSYFLTPWIIIINIIIYLLSIIDILKLKTRVVCKFYTWIKIKNKLNRIGIFSNCV